MATLAIIGSRSFSNQALAEEAFKKYCCEFNDSLCSSDDCEMYMPRFNTIVSGGARGGDEIGAEIARKWDLKLVEHLPDWENLGKRAGFVRNEKIIADADTVLAFWGIDPKTGELSKGTQHSLSLAKKMRKTTIIIYV
jgi:hypothetical protein